MKIEGNKQDEVAEKNEIIKWLIKSYSECYKKQDDFLSDVSKDIADCYIDPNGSHSKLMDKIKSKYILIKK